MGEQATERDDEAIYKELYALEHKYVQAKITWYQTKKRWPRRIYHLSTFLLIALSACVPALVHIEGFVNDVLVPTITVLIAALTTMSLHFQWGSVWKGFHGAQLAIEGMVARWEMQMLKAKRFKDRDKGQDQAIEATQALLEAAGVAENDETMRFFEMIRQSRVDHSTVPHDVRGTSDTLSKRS